MKKRIASEITALTMPAKTFEKIVLSFISIPRGGQPPGAFRPKVLLNRSRQSHSLEWFIYAGTVLVFCLHPKKP